MARGDRAAGAPAAGATELARQLAGAPPAEVLSLGERELTHLADAIAAARRRQAAELAAAGERALRFVPRLLRGPLMRVLA